jgi:hypothetical protein
VPVEHRAFYVFRHQLVCEARAYPRLSKPICLMTIHYPTVAEDVRSVVIAKFYVEKPARSATTAAADFIGETGTVPEPQAVACPSCGAQLMFRRSPQPFIDSCGFESSASHAENAQLRWPASSIGATTRCCFSELATHVG